MDDLALSVRTARPEDAADLARIYIESWQDTYAGVVSHALLGAMSHKGHTARWRTSIRTMGSTGAVLVAEDARFGAIGLCSLGAARDRGLGFEGEVYTLYVDPAFLGSRRRTCAAGGRLSTPSRNGPLTLVPDLGACPQQCLLEYGAIGGRRVAIRTTRLMGELTPEIGFG